VPGPHLVERQLPGDGGEEFLHVLGRLGRRLKEEEAGFARVRLGVGRLDCPLVRLLRHQVQLVARQRDDDILVGLPLQLLDPRLGLVK
jgi:hypothetical protein